jgi:DHA2 family multidrug resistance protein-like MFS transporter
MSEITNSPVAGRAGRREWIGLAVLVLPCLLISMDIGVLFFAVPFISADLAPSATQQLWIIDMYGFVLAGLLITMGALGDRIGRRRLLLCGAAAFGAASILAAYSGSAGTLIGARAVLGVGGATLMPSTLALIRNMFHDPQQRKAAIAAWTGGMTGGVTLGPIVGGFLLDHFWWGSVFLINLPAMALLLVLGPILLPEFRDPKPGRFDLIGAVLSLVAVLTVIYGIKRMTVEGFEVLPAGSIAVGLLLGVVFIRRQRISTNPLIDVRLFRHRAFAGSITINVIAMFALTGYALFTTQYMQLVLGLSPFVAALWSLAATPAIMISLTVTAILAKRIRPAYLMCAGLIIAAIGFGMLTQVRADSSLLFLLSAAGTLVAGVLMATTLTADMILSAAPPERAGSASALSETSSELGGALGIAILGSIGAAVYHHEMARSPVAAADTLGGAVAVAAQLPGEAGAALLHAGRVAFTMGLNLTAISGAITMLVGAILSIMLLRHVKVTGTPAPDAETEAEAAASAPAPAAAVAAATDGRGSRG